MMPRGREREALPHQALEHAVGDAAGAEGVDVERHRLGDADGVGELHLDALGEAGGDQVLGHVPRHVAGRAIDLGRILAREGAAAVTAEAAVGVDDDLAAGEAAVALRAADDEASGRIDVDRWSCRRGAAPGARAR